MRDNVIKLYLVTLKNNKFKLNRTLAILLLNSLIMIIIKHNNVMSISPKYLTVKYKYTKAKQRSQNNVHLCNKIVSPLE